MTALAKNHTSTSAQFLGRLGELTTRLSTGQKELASLQRLRYQVFYEEMQAQPTASQKRLKLDYDEHDANCEHLIVLDANENIAGTQRLFLCRPGRQSADFHSQPEFDVAGLRARHPDLTFLELGRSAILPEYRTSRTAELLWHGTWAYVIDRKVDVMIGCASFNAKQFSDIAPALGYLAGYTADQNWEVSPTSSCARELGEYLGDVRDNRKAARSLPPLIKGYLRLGAMVSSHAVRDEQFNTIDIFIILPVERISERYIRYYGTNADRRREQN